MKKIIIGTISMVTLICIGCSPAIMTSYNEDPGADFSQYKTFAWDIPLNKATDESSNALVNNSLVSKQLKDAILAEMIARGYKVVERNPDILINFHTMVESRSEVSSYPNNYYFWWRNDIHTVNYKEGTLIVDLIDARKDQLVWQGYTSNELRSDKLAASLKDAVELIFRKFPYHAGSDQKVISRVSDQSQSRQKF